MIKYYKKVVDYSKRTGKNNQKVGDHFEITRERVRQILRDHGNGEPNTK